MSLDFYVTHFYRLVVHDMVLMNDVYWFYTQNRKEGRSIKEFSEILANLLEVESQNFEEINTAKLSIGEGEGVLLIIWDYFHDVIIKHLLDDASQFPFWASKVIVTTQPGTFGMPIIRAYINCMRNIYTTRGIRGLFEGCGPYMLASCYHNYRFLVKVTHAFILNVFSKIPHPGTLPLEDELASPLGSPVARSGKGSSSSGKSGKLMALKDAAAMEDPSDLSEDIDTPVATAPATPRFRHKTRSNGDLTLLTTGVPAAAVAASTVAGLPAVLQSGASGGSTASSSANSTSTVSSTGAGGITLGGPPGMSSKQSGFANANYNSYANTSSGGGGEGHFSAVSTIRPKKQPPPQQTDNLFMRQLHKAGVAFLTHPLLLLAVTMVTNPQYQGHNSVWAFFKMSTTTGIVGQYRGLRSRIVSCLIPLSPIMMLGIADAVVYRRMVGQGTMDRSGGVISVIQHITSESNNPAGRASVMNLLNYGLLSVVHAVPGFLSFLTMRSVSWLVMGSSLQRKHQISRRKEIVEAHITLIDKKAQYE